MLGDAELRRLEDLRKGDSVLSPGEEEEEYEEVLGFLHSLPGEGAFVQYCMEKKFRKIPKNPEKSQKWACAARFARGARPFLDFSRNFPAGSFFPYNTVNTHTTPEPKWPRFVRSVRQDFII